MALHKDLATVVVVAIAAGVASADTVDMRFVGTGDGFRQDVWLGSHKLNNVFVGELLHTFSNGTGAGARLDGQTLVTFCTDLLQSVNSSGSTYDIVNPGTLPQNGSESIGMGEIRANALSNLLKYRESMGDDAFDSSREADAFSTAMQLMVWEIVFETNLTSDPSLSSIDVTNGVFRATSADGSLLGRRIRGYADQLKNEALGYEGNGTIIGFGSDNDQDQVTIVMVPLPGTAGLGLLGFSAVASRRRR